MGDKKISKIPKSHWGVHINHCCSNHGCKYGDVDCPVWLGMTNAKYPCEVCDSDSDLDFNGNEIRENTEELFRRFINWKSSLKSEMRGGVLMYDVPDYYKWLNELELFQYWVDANKNFKT